MVGPFYGLVFEIVLYDDSACTNEIGRTRTSVPLSFFEGPISGGRTVPIYTGIVLKDRPIYAKVASNYGGADIDISILYKEVV